jgi:hypothetical protein
LKTGKRQTPKEQIMESSPYRYKPFEETALAEICWMLFCIKAKMRSENLASPQSTLC